MASDERRDWERPWTTEEIVERADNWNLACDAALLNTLKQFGDKFMEKAEQVHGKLDKLCTDLDEVHLRVDLARNEFNSLRNSQFMECRVYDEDETLLMENKEEIKTEDDVAKEETMDDLKEAVSLGLDILNEYYERVEVEVSDSEDDDDENIPNYVYRRKDPYINRPLPHVIGSEEWYKKWHVGLQESSDSENEKSSSDKFSESEDDEDYQIKEHSDVSSELNLSGLNNNNLGGEPVAVSTANTTLHRNEDFVASQMLKGASFAEQLAEKLGDVIKNNNLVVETDEVNRRSIQKKNDNYGALFSDEPPPLDDDNFMNQEPHGIFSGGKGLFDDEEDVDDLWSSVNTKISKPTSQEFKSNVQTRGIFDDDESSEDDLFSPKASKINQPYLISNKSTVPMFNEEPPSLGSQKDNVKEKKAPPGGVSLFGNVDIFRGRKIGGLIQRKQNDSSNEEDDDVVNPSTKSVEAIEKEIRVEENVQKPSVSNENSAMNKTKINDLTFESDEDDFFANIKPSKMSQEPLKNSSSKQKFGSLFDDSVNDDASDLFEPKIEKTKPNSTDMSVGIDKEDAPTVQKVEKKVALNLFDDSFDEVDDLFSEILKNSKLNISESKEKIEESTKKPLHSDITEEENKNISKVSNQSDQNVSKLESSSTSSNSTVPNLNFFDAVPPEIDWENNSDNNEDEDQFNEDFQSQSASLFDNEPPSLLLNNTSGVVEGNSNRVDSISNSFDPSLTSSRRLSSDFFNESHTNDSIFSTNHENRQRIESRRLETTKEIVSDGDGDIFTDLTPSGNPDELYFDSTVNDSSADIRKDDASDLVIKDKILDNDENEIDPATNKVQKSRDIKEAEMSGRVSDIAQKFLRESSENNEKSSSINNNNVAVPKKLRHSLNINVGALLPGSAPPKKDKPQSPNDQIENKSPSINDSQNLPTKPPSILRPSSEGDFRQKISRSVSFEDDANTNVEVLKSITKDRVRIPVKRKPSTKRGRQELRNSIIEIEQESSKLENLHDEAEPKLENSQDESKLRVDSEQRYNDLFGESRKLDETTALFDETKEESFPPKQKLYSEEKVEHLFENTKKFDDEMKSLFEDENKRNPSLFDDIDKSISIEPGNSGGAKQGSGNSNFALFQDEDDDLFNVPKKIEINTKTNQSNKKNEYEIKRESLFSDEVVKPKSLFELSDEEPDDFPTKAAKSNSNTESKPSPNKIERTVKLFDSSDEDDDFLKSLSRDKSGTKPSSHKNNYSNQNKKVSLFDEDEDDGEDIFGTSDKKIQPSVIKKTPKSTNLRKLENVEIENDPLSAMLK